MCSGIKVQKSPVFRRDGADVHSDLFVSVAQAILGGTARTQGLYETLNLSVSISAHSQVSPPMGEHHSIINYWIFPLLSDPCRHPDRPEDSSVREGDRSPQWPWLRRPLCPCQNKSSQVRLHRQTHILFIFLFQ